MICYAFGKKLSKPDRFENHLTHWHLPSAVLMKLGVRDVGAEGGLLRANVIGSAAKAGQ